MTKFNKSKTYIGNLEILSINKTNKGIEIKTNEYGLGTIICNDRKHKHIDGVFFINGNINGNIFYKTPGSEKQLIGFIGEEKKPLSKREKILKSKKDGLLTINKKNEQLNSKINSIEYKTKFDIKKLNKTISELQELALSNIKEFDKKGVEAFAPFTKEIKDELDYKSKEFDKKYNEALSIVYKNNKISSEALDKIIPVFKKIKANTSSLLELKITNNDKINTITNCINNNKKIADLDRKDIKDTIVEINYQNDKSHNILNKSISKNKISIEKLNKRILDDIKLLEDELSVSINNNTDAINKNTSNITKNKVKIGIVEGKIDKIKPGSGINFNNGEISVNIDKDTVILKKDKIAVNLDKFYTKEQVRKNIEANMGSTIIRGGSASSAKKVKTDTTDFNGALSSADDTVQKALDTLDDTVGGITKPYDRMYDPAVNTALTTSKLDNYGGTIITTTTTGNNQTFSSPTNINPGGSNIFIVINDDTSTNSFDVIDSTKTITIQPGTAQKYVWDGTAWIAVEAVDASNITNIPSGDISATNVQNAINELDTEKASLGFSIAMAVAL